MISRGWRRSLARSRNPVVLALKAIANAPDKVSLPVPGVIAQPLKWGYLAGRSVVFFARRVFIAEPFFKTYVTEHGSGIHTGIFLHWINGNGEFILGNNVLLDGKSSFTFARRFVDSPRLIIGDRTGLGHNCDITVGKEVRIGNNCRIASGVIITDSSGHPAEAASRLNNAPPSDEDVRPVSIGNNVWIGKRAIILPGVTIGEGSIVAAGAVVMTDIPPFTMAAGNPARKVASVPRGGDGVPAVQPPAPRPGGSAQ